MAFTQFILHYVRIGELTLNMRNIYRKIAKMYGVTVADVKKDMQEAIDYAYKKQNKSSNEKIKQLDVRYEDETPTTEEFLEYVLQELKSQK